MGVNRHLLDSNFIIDYLDGAEFAAKYFQTIVDDELYMSVITRIELLSFGGCSDEEVERGILRFIDRFQVIPLHKPVEKLTVAIRRATRRKLPDAIIAASALHAGATLVTSDNRLASTSYPDLHIVNPMSL